MLISLNWIRDFVDLPDDLHPKELAEAFTRTTAEVEGAGPVKVGARGLIVARVESVAELADARSRRLVHLDVGQGKMVETVTAAAAIHVGTQVVYAPVGASVAAIGEIGSATDAGQRSVGMILPGDALVIALAVGEAVFVSDSMPPGEELSPDLFDDWVLDIDNKSLTNRPDLWGHYGIAREIAAIYNTPLKPYPVAKLEELSREGLSGFPISIADGEACPRYSGIVLEGVATQPAPLWMQLRLGRVGMRPISALVDLTNYIMAELGQPMHAFDAAKVGRIEVDFANNGQRLRTIDGVERELFGDTLMIQCQGVNIALAGIMGGLETEVCDTTTSLLLESANFNPVTIRKASGRLGLRTDASARFEKSLDPANTVLSIRRFIELARPQFPKMRVVGGLSDCHPQPLGSVTVVVNRRRVERMIGRELSGDEVARTLSPLGFEVTDTDTGWNVGVPSFRATGDVAIEVDVIEEIARRIGYDTITPALPMVAVRRFEPNALHQLEQSTLAYFTTAHNFHELHGYIWYDQSWLAQLGVDAGPCVELANPPAQGMHRLRRTLMPSLLGSVVRNRFHFPAFALLELGSVFETGPDADHEFRSLGLIIARRGKQYEDELYARLKAAIAGWAWRGLVRPVSFLPADADANRPWDHRARTATVHIDGAGGRHGQGQLGRVQADRHNDQAQLVPGGAVGRISVVDLALRRTMDEHLGAWSIAWAELRLSGLDTLDSKAEPLGTIPPYPLVEMDFSMLVARSTRYCDVASRLAAFDDDLLMDIRFVSSYEGRSISSNQRSLTFRTTVGDSTRTLIEEDVRRFRRDFEQHIRQCGYEIRQPETRSSTETRPNTETRP